MDTGTLACVALDQPLSDDYPVNEVTMKIKTTFYTRTKGEDFDPVIHVRYPKSRADQLSYQPTSKLIDQMIRTGQMVLASKNQFDFPDGKDDGRDIPIDRMRGLDYPEISQMMSENEAKISKHKKNLATMAEQKKAEEAEQAEKAVASDGGKSVATDAKANDGVSASSANP